MKDWTMFMFPAWARRSSLLCDLRCEVRTHATFLAYAKRITSTWRPAAVPNTYARTVITPSGSKQKVPRVDRQKRG